MQPPPLSGRMISKIARARLEREGKQEGVQELVQFVFDFKIFPFLRWPQNMLNPFNLLSIRPQHVMREMAILAKLISDLKPLCLLEIGTAYGGTLFVLCKVASPDADCVSIDLPGGSFGGGYPTWKIPLYHSFAQEHQKLHLIRGNSHHPDVLKRVQAILHARPLDLLFIDADHTYAGVKNDFDMYSPLVRKGGIIAMHDIVPPPSENGCEVSQFWNEVKLEYCHQEIIANHKWGGIGVLHV